jgi:predicted RNase H-like HicB family nuclease
MNDAERYAVTVRKVVVDDEELWRATVRELPDVAEFAATREEAMDLALDAIESLKKAAQEDGRPFPEPIDDEEEYSGRVTLRMSKSMHRATALRAIDEDVSLNSYIVECIAARQLTNISTQLSASASSVRFDYHKYLLQKVLTNAHNVPGLTISPTVGVGVGNVGAYVARQVAVLDIATQFLSEGGAPAVPEDEPQRRQA